MISPFLAFFNRFMASFVVTIEIIKHDKKVKIKIEIS